MMDNTLILSVGMPRAGSGWFYNLTHDLILASGGVDAHTVRQRYRLQPFLTQVNCNIGTLSFYRLLPVLLPLAFEGSYVIKLHGGRKPLADLFIKAGIIKPTYIFRDPRDALLSAYEYGERMRSRGKTNAFTPLTTIEEAILFMEEYVQIAKGWLRLEPVLAVKYEDLLLAYDRTTGALLDYLGCDPASPSIKDVIGKYRPGQGDPDQAGTHFVKGKIGRHRDLFSSREKEICREKFGPFLEKWNYSDL